MRSPSVGVPGYLSAGTESRVQARIVSLQGQQQTEDRGEAECLATEIGQHEVRSVMEAQDARTPESGGNSPSSSAVGADGEQQEARASDGAPASPSGFSQASDFEGIESPQVGPDARAQSQEGVEEDGAGVASEPTLAAGEEEGAGGAGRDEGEGAEGATASAEELSGDVGGDVAPEAPQTGAGDLETGDLVLIDIELAEHQRWAAADAHVGAAGSDLRAQFVAEQVGSGFVSGVASGAAMGLGIGLVTRAVPVLGPVIGGGMALHGLLTQDWDATAATIGAFGEGNGTYDTLANTLASVSAVIDIATQVLDVITGIVGVVEAVAIGVAAGAGVLAFFTFGATAGVAIAAGELAVTCEEIREGVGVVSLALTNINNELLNPCILLFRALHSFTSQADPREIEDGGQELSAAGGAVGGALGGWLGGHAAQLGGRARPPADDGAPTTQRRLRELPPPATDAPDVHFTRPAGQVDVPTVGGGPPHSTADQPHSPAITPEHVAPPAASTAPAPPSLLTVPTPAGTGAGGGGGGGAGGPGTPGGGGPAAIPVLTGRRPEPGGMVIHEFGRPGVDSLKDLDVDATVAALDPHVPGGPAATSDSFFELPAGRDVLPPAGAAGAAPTLPPHGLQDVEIRMNPDPTRIQYHENMEFAGVWHARIAEHGGIAVDGPRGATLGAPDTPHTAGSVLPDDPAVVTTSPVPVRNPPSPRAGEPWPVEVRLHSPNPSPALAANAPDAHSRFNPTVQVNTENGRYLLPDNRWVPQNSPDIGAGHYPAGGRDRGPAGTGEVPSLTPGGGGGPGPAGGGPASGGGPPPGANGPSAATTRGAEPSVIVDHAALGLSPTDTPTTDTVRAAPAAPETDVDWRRLGGSHEEIMANLRRLEEHPEQGAYDPANPSTTGPYRGELGMTIKDPRTGLPVYKPEAVFSLTPDRPTFGVRAGPGGAWIDHVFTSRAEAEAYAAQQATLGEESIRSTSALPRGWPADTSGKVWPGNPVDQFRVFEVPPNTPNIRSVVGPQPEGSPASGRPDVYPGGGPQTQLPGGLINRGSVPLSEFPIPPAGGSGGPSNTLLATPGSPGAAASAGVSSAASASSPVALPAVLRGRDPGGWAARAGQLGALFLPQLFGSGGEAPTYAQQRAAHRDRFTEDNQPAEGVERANPHYSAPPATPEQIVAMQNQILNLLAVRSRAEVEAGHEGERLEACRANRGPIRASVADTQGGLSAIAAHEQAIARRTAANQEQQRRQQDAAGLTSGYADRAAGFAALTIPLAAWEGFTNLASHLPGSAGDRMGEMNAQARQMQESFEHMGSDMGDADGQQPICEAGLVDDAQRIADTSEQATNTYADLRTAADGAVAMREANEATAQAAQSRQNEALQRRDSLEAAAQEREHAVASLAAQLAEWAQQHQSERAAAVVEVVQRRERAGYTITAQPAP